MAFYDLPKLTPELENLRGVYLDSRGGLRESTKRESELYGIAITFEGRLTEKELKYSSEYSNNDLLSGLFTREQYAQGPDRVIEYRKAYWEYIQAVAQSRKITKENYKAKKAYEEELFSWSIKHEVDG